MHDETIYLVLNVFLVRIILFYLWWFWKITFKVTSLCRWCRRSCLCIAAFEHLGEAGVFWNEEEEFLAGKTVDLITRMWNFYQVQLFLSLLFLSSTHWTPFQETRVQVHYIPNKENRFPPFPSTSLWQGREELFHFSFLSPDLVFNRMWEIPPGTFKELEDSNTVSLQFAIGTCGLYCNQHFNSQTISIQNKLIIPSAHSKHVHNISLEDLYLFSLPIYIK